MVYTICFVFCLLGTIGQSQVWNTTDGILPWESYLQLGDIKRPLGLILNYSSMAHRHFAIGYLCLHSFMYDEANAAFDLAISIYPAFVEAHVGKILSCKRPLWGFTDFDCGLEACNAAQMLDTSLITSFQRQLLLTAYQWFAYNPNIETGEDAFLVAMRNLSENYPNKTDIHVLLGLSLLNIGSQVKYQSQAEPLQMKEARVVLQDVIKKEPNHPGALHYLIHAYDVFQVNIAEQGRDYAYQYGKNTPTTSHGQHMPAHIWVRTGSWKLALLADEHAITSSLTLCVTKLLNHSAPTSSIELTLVLNQLNTTQRVLLLQCDVDNRAHSLEWLSYARIQTGDLLGSIAMVQDLFTSDNQSILTPNHYLQHAYLAQTRIVTEIFQWFPYDIHFIDLTKYLSNFNESKAISLEAKNMTQWHPIWSEAGIRLSDCIRLLMTRNDSDANLLIDKHIVRIDELSNKLVLINQYISNIISIMIPQIRAIRYYINQSWQECLNELNDSVQREAKFVPDMSSPRFIITYSTELLALHLLLLHKKFQLGSMPQNYTWTNRQISIVDFPTTALNLYKIANKTAPNRAVNILGMAKANAQLGNIKEAISLYQLLLIQMKSSLNTHPIFIQEAYSYIAQNSIHSDSVFYKHDHLSLIFLLLFFGLFQNI